MTLEISSIKDVNADIVEYTLEPRSTAAGRPLSQLALPDGAVVALIARQQTLIPPRGSTVLLAGDHVFVVLRAEARPQIDRIFSRGPAAAPDTPLPSPDDQA